MKLDLSAIKNKIAELNGDSRNSNSSNVQLWKPGLGEYKVRGMHWPEALNIVSPGEPFVERHFYYNIAPYGILAPKQFGKDDPIHDLRIALFKTGVADDKLIAKKLFSRMRCYMPLIVKEGTGADPDKVVIWSFGKMVYEKLLGYFVKDDIGDYLDPREGFDLDISITKKGGKQYNDTNIELARRPSPLAKSDEAMLALKESVPDISDLYTLKSSKEVKGLLDAWLNGGEVSDNTEGTEKSSNDKSDSALDELVNEVKEPKKEKKAKAPKATKVKKEEEADDEVNPKVADDLDSAFEDLMSDDE